MSDDQELQDLAKTGKKILCMDFDGVIHSYVSGWQGAETIPDDPVEGAFEFLHEAICNFTVAIYSARSGLPGGIKAMQEWLYRHEKIWRSSCETPLPRTCLALCLKWPESKPPAFLTIDDRAMTFTGKWPTQEILKNFKTWNDRGV